LFADAPLGASISGASFGEGSGVAFTTGTTSEFETTHYETSGQIALPYMDILEIKTSQTFSIAPLPLALHIDTYTDSVVHDIY